MTTTEMIAVLQAFERGEAIQYRNRNSKKWRPVNPIWNFSLYDYRARPRPREWWINVYSKDALTFFRHDSRANADEANMRAGGQRIECVHMGEGLDDPEEG